MGILSAGDNVNLAEWSVFGNIGVETPQVAEHICSLRAFHLELSPRSLPHVSVPASNPIPSKLPQHQKTSQRLPANALSQNSVLSLAGNNTRARNVVVQKHVLRMLREPCQFYVVRVGVVHELARTPDKRAMRRACRLLHVPFADPFSLSLVARASGLGYLLSLYPSWSYTCEIIAHSTYRVCTLQKQTS